MDKSRILTLYRNMMRESKRTPSYDFREYFIRRVRDAFKENKALTDPGTINRKVAEAKENLELIKRQATIGQFYKVDKLVIEK